VSALRFLFVKTLHRHFLAEYIPFPKSGKRLPTVLSPEEVARLISSARNLYHRTLLMTLYSTAMRRAELCLRSKWSKWHGASGWQRRQESERLPRD
jgi:integrase